MFTEKLCQQCFEDYVPPSEDDDGFCSDSCKKVHDREMSDEADKSER